MLDLFMALGEGQTNFVVDQRLPYQHAHALLLLTELLEGAQRSTKVYIKKKRKMLSPELYEVYIKTKSVVCRGPRPCTRCSSLS